MKVFDCFTYFNEDHLLDLRFNILNDYVDFFVICEAKEDHRGRTKKLNFEIEKYSKFKSKIIYLVIDKFIPPLNENDFLHNFSYLENSMDLILDKTPDKDNIRSYCIYKRKAI